MRTLFLHSLAGLAIAAIFVDVGIAASFCRADDKQVPKVMEWDCSTDHGVARVDWPPNKRDEQSVFIKVKNPFRLVVRPGKSFTENVTVVLAGQAIDKLIFVSVNCEKENAESAYHHALTLADTFDLPKRKHRRMVEKTFD